MKKTKLKDICNISAGGTPSRSNINYWNNGDIPWCKIGDFSGKYINQVKENITEEGLKNSSAKIFKRGTILYTIFATVGEVAILETESATNQAIAGLEIINNEVELEYLYYYLKSLKFVMLKKSRGVAQNNINLGILKNIEIKIPDKEEQINIAKILDNIEKIIGKKKKQLEELNAIIKSQFVEMFGNIHFNDKKWNKNKWRDVLIIKNGKNQKKVESFNGKYPIYGSGGIIGFANDYICNENSIIIGRKGSINKPILVKTKFWNVDTAFGLEPIKEKIKADYLYYFCCFYNFEKHNKAVTIPSLTKKDLLNIEISVPPITLQNQFAEIVKQIDKQKFESMIQLDKENRIVLKNIIKDTIEETNIIYEFLFKKYFEEGK